MGAETGEKWRADVTTPGENVGLRGRVLRLRKRSTPADSAGAGGRQPAAAFAPTDIEASYAFLRDAVRPHIACDQDYVPLGQLIEVAEPFLVELRRLCAPHRPAARLERELDPQARHGWLLPDLAYLPRHLVPRTPAHSHTRDAAPPRVLSVEIKPKSGVLPCATVVSPDKAIKATVSRFQMMQRTKMHQGKVVHLSGYDPLQLFSRKRSEIKAALRALLLQPQNNLLLRTWELAEEEVGEEEVGATRAVMLSGQDRRQRYLFKSLRAG